MELQIIKHTSSLGSLVIKVIDKSLAKEMVIKNHGFSKSKNWQYSLYLS